jgi:TonB family protein
MYIRRKSRVSKIAVLVSAILHSIAFFTFALVKFHTDEEVEGAKVAVTFVDQQQTRVLKRSLSVRPTASLERSQQHRPAGQRVDTRVSYRKSSEFYVEDKPRVFSEVRSVAHKAIRTASMQRPTINLRRELTKGISVDVRESGSRPSQLQLGVSGGTQFLGENSMALARPEVRVATDTRNVLQEFLKAVRRKIESSKKYPTSARDAGIEGSSGIKMTILKDGRLEKVEIIDSSGNEILDGAALQSVRSAAPFPPIPEETGRERIEMSIYLVFKIT